MTQPLKADECHRDVQHDGHHTDGQGEQPVQNQRQAGKTGHGKSRRHRKIIQTDGRKEAANNFHQYICGPAAAKELFHVFLRLSQNKKSKPDLV